MLGTRMLLSSSLPTSDHARVAVLVAVFKLKRLRTTEASIEHVFLLMDSMTVEPAQRPGERVPPDLPCLAQFECLGLE